MDLVRNVFKTVTFRQSTVTTLSTILNGLLGATFYFLLARLLGPHDYGIFILGVTIIAVLATVFDLGSDQGLVRFIPKYKNDPLALKRITKLALEIKIVTGGLVFLILFLFGKDIANFFAKPELGEITFLVGIGVVAQLLFSFATSLSQALERFFLWGGLFIGTNFLRLLLVILIFAPGYLNSLSTVTLYVFCPLIGFIFSFLFLDKNFLSTKGEMSYFRQFFGFNKWITGFVLISALSSRLDIFFVTKFLSLESVGIYGLAIQASALLVQLTSALEAVISLKFASLTTYKENMIYTLKATLFFLAAAFVGIVVLIPVSFAIFKFAGKGYEMATFPFLLLTAGMIIFLVVTPVRDSIIYFFEKPVFFFWTSLASLCLMVFFSLFLVPKFGIVGASLVVLIGQVFMGVFSIGYFFSKK